MDTSWCGGKVDMFLLLFAVVVFRDADMSHSLTPQEPGRLEFYNP